ncbi:unnamed protein product [Linum trigynum]|uniref:Uncharacterized protein n=1 Tax=Linum trigynum TaxID=586398 RepID=A0AAV2E488_9ROSI
MPAPPRPSFRADERIVPPQEPPRRSRRRVRENIEELRPSQQTQLPEPWAHCEWATSTEGTGGSSSYVATQEHDMFAAQATPHFHHQQQSAQYQTPLQQHTSSTFYHASGSSQPVRPPPPVYTPVGGRVKRNPRGVVQRAREEGGGREGGRRGRGGRGGRGRGREGEVEEEGNEENQ